jgi:hypothetical protein
MMRIGELNMREGVNGKVGAETFEESYFLNICVG